MERLDKGTQLNKDEIEMLVEALEVWENDTGSGNLMVDIIEHMLARDCNPEQKERMRREKNDFKTKCEEEKKMRKEISTLLKAKLILMKKDIDIKELERL